MLQDSHKLFSGEILQNFFAARGSAPRSVGPLIRPSPGTQLEIRTTPTV